MNNKNLLLGFGETLTHPVKRPQSPVNKSHPYSVEEARQHLLNSSIELLKTFDSIPTAAMPNGKIVTNFILHPAYLAKSYYPSKLFNRFNFKDLGSKSILVKPRKSTRKDTDINLVTSNIYLSGNKEAFEELINTLEDQYSIDSVISQEIIKHEEFTLLTNRERIKGELTSNLGLGYEVVLHTPYDERKDVLETFIEFCKISNIDLNLDRRIEIPGLTFLPIQSDVGQIREISSFTYLRAVRNMPKLRMFEPLIRTTMFEIPGLTLPMEDSVNPNINVAVFDGGIGNTNLSKWCNEHVFTSSITNQNLLNHGSEVTSTILFGNVTSEQTSLPRPYSNIDHYRVLDNSISTHPDLFDVLQRILDSLKTKQYHFVNLSIGPHMPIDDDDVHVWTSVLDDYLANNNTLMTVAVGNDGDLIDNRIQPPSDMVNALAIGASTSKELNWQRTYYSCIGPGRSPGLIKPDGIAFGGDQDNPFLVYSPITNSIHSTAGTSFAAPLVLRNCIGLASTLESEINPLMVKALMIHNIEENSKLAQEEVGRGLFPHNIDSILFSSDNEVSIVYKGKIEAAQCIRMPIPFPSNKIDKGMVNVKATFCFTAPVNPTHPNNYTDKGLIITFRPQDGKTITFFSQKEMFETEQESRSDAHKWETTLHNSKRMQIATLENPCFDVIYHARDAGKTVKSEYAGSLPYVLILTVKISNDNQLYNKIRQEYQTLQPIKIRQDIKVRI